MDNHNHTNRSDASHITSTARTIDTNSPQKPLMPKRGKQGLKIFVVVLLLAGLVAGGVYLFTQRKSNQKNTLSNKSVYDEAIKSYNSFPGVSNLSTEDRAKLDAEIQPQYLAGYVTGFGPNANEISTAPGVIGNTAAPATISAYIQSIINNKTQLAKTTGYYQGYVFYFWYDDAPTASTVEQVPNTIQPAVVPNTIQPAVVIADKQYASQKAKEYQQKLANGSITPQKAADELLLDRRLALFDQSNNSGYFATALPLGASGSLIHEIAKLAGETNPGQGDSTNNMLSNARGPGLTALATINAVPGGPASGIKKEVGFMMAYLDLVLKGQGSIDRYQSELNIAKAKLQ